MAFGEQGAGFRNQLIPFFEAGNTIIINKAGLFVYKGKPANGNLVASIAPSNGVDPFGNSYKETFGNYQITAPFGVLTIDGAELIFGSNNPSSLITTDGVVFQVDSLGVSQRPELRLQSPLAAFQGASWLIMYGESPDATGINQIWMTPVTGGVPVTSQFVETNGSVGIVVNNSTGEALLIQNGSVSTGNPNVQLLGTGATDNMLGIEITGDSSNRFKVNAAGLMQWGSGAAGQDTRLYRAAAGQFGVDTLLANVAGNVAETWHSLGTLAGATVNKGRYRFLPDGEVKVEIDITFAVSTAVPITFSNTLPAAYQIPGAVDGRFPMAQTNAAGGFGRIFVGSAGGGSAGQVQFTTLGAGNAIGVYSAYFSYSIL